MDCNFQKTNERWVCQREGCNNSVRAKGDLPPRMRCALAGEEVGMQLGDRLESLLKKVGITEEKYRELKEMAGLDPTCNCGSRKRFLNKLPAALALGYARGGICGAYDSAVQLAQENKEYFSKPR